MGNNKIPRDHKEVTLTIDGKTVKARSYETVLDAARRAGIEIPTLANTKTCRRSARADFASSRSTDSAACRRAVS